MSEMTMNNYASIHILGKTSTEIKQFLENDNDNSEISEAHIELQKDFLNLFKKCSAMKNKNR